MDEDTNEINKKIKEMCLTSKKEIIFRIVGNNVEPLVLKYVQDELIYVYFVVEDICKEPYRVCSKGFERKELFLKEIDALEYLKNKSEKRLKQANENLDEGEVYTEIFRKENLRQLSAKGEGEE